LEAEEDVSVTIDMDEVADAAMKGLPSPTFRGSEESQQLKYQCSNCKTTNDIIGTCGYCTACGMRNDFDQFSSVAIPAMRKRLIDGAPADSVLRDAVSAFDSYIGHFAQRVPMIKPRRERLLRPFHDIEESAKNLSDWFGIRLFQGFSEAEQTQLKRMFLRRHVHEHRGGMVDQTYIDKSNDASVRMGQKLTEVPEEIHGLLSHLLSMAKRVQEGFHDIFPFERRDAAMTPILQFVAQA
jgi:hypothetical protein